MVMAAAAVEAAARRGHRRRVAAGGRCGERAGDGWRGREPEQLRPKRAGEQRRRRRAAPAVSAAEKLHTVLLAVIRWPGCRERVIGPSCDSNAPLAACSAPHTTCRPLPASHALPHTWTSTPSTWTADSSVSSCLRASASACSPLQPPPGPPGPTRRARGAAQRDGKPARTNAARRAAATPAAPPLAGPPLPPPLACRREGEAYGAVR